MTLQPHNLTPEVVELDRHHIQEMIDSGMTHDEIDNALLDSGYDATTVSKIMLDLDSYHKH